MTPRIGEGMKSQEGAGVVGKGSSNPTLLAAPINLVHRFVQWILKVTDLCDAAEMSNSYSQPFCQSFPIWTKLSRHMTIYKFREPTENNVYIQFFLQMFS